MTEFSQGLVVLNRRGKIRIIDRSPGAATVAPEDSQMLDLLDSGTYWAIGRRIECERPACVLTRLTRVVDGDLAFTTPERVAVRFPLDDSFSEGFRRMIAESVRPSLEAKRIPQPVIEAYIQAHVEPFEDSIVG